MPAPRSAYRFRIQEPLQGRFGHVNVSICDLSEKGLQIEHSEALPQGFTGNLSYTIPGRKKQIDLHGEIRWSVADSSGMNSRYRSGIAIDENSEALTSCLDLFIRKGIAKLDRGARESKKPTVYPANASPNSEFVIADGAPMQSRQDDGGVSVEQRAIEQARERLGSSFDESLRWYNRARYAMAEDSVRQAVIGIRHKEDVLAVWEFLGRTIDIATIAKVFNRRTY